jgi:hypothetical protein
LVLIPDRQEGAQRHRAVAPVGVEEAVLVVGQPEQRSSTTVVEKRAVRLLVD